jgi:hypothetical protein
MSQSRTLYVPAIAIGGYATEGQLMPVFEELVELFIEIEKNQFIIVDGNRYDNVIMFLLR